MVAAAECEGSIGDLLVRNLLVLRQQKHVVFVDLRLASIVEVVKHNVCLD